MTDIAIVGMDCRFPAAPDPAALWDLLMRGEESVTEIPRSRWDADAYYDPEGGPGRSNTRHAGFIEDADAFDHEFFEFSEAEAAASDPQVRLLLQTAWRALEDATLDPRAQAGSRTGVYMGVMWSHWASLMVNHVDAVTAHSGAGSGHTMAANRISHFLDLTGPSMAIDTACSSSLVAVEQACAALRSGQCDQALAGGVNVFVTPASNVHNTQAKVSAPDGRSKPFSAHADGFGSAEGVGVLVLRRLGDALEAGLPVYAVIKGGSINHGGRSSTVTAPNPAAHQAVMGEAYERSGVTAADVAFVEAHGTGTPLGDRLEVRALGRVHGVPRDEPCALGSIKGNIGHAEGAAGIAGLIKVALALHHRVLPASRYAADESPRLRLAKNGLRLAVEPLPLHAGTVNGAVSAFGWGGTNAHLVLATAPEAAPAREGGVGDGGGVLTVSAPDAAGLRRAVSLLAADVAARSDVPLDELAWSSNQVKASGPARFALAVRDRDVALAELEKAADAVNAADAADAADAPQPERLAVGWLFPGADAWSPGMSRELHSRSPLYRRALAETDHALQPHLGWSVRDALFVAGSEETAGPVVFAVAHALGRTLADLGVVPDWTAGHGVGQYAAAVLAGELDLTDAARLVAATPDASGRADAEIEKGLDGGPTHLVEIAGALAAPLAAPHRSSRLLPPGADGDELLRLVADLYQAGLDPTWDQLYEPDRQVRHRLSPYTFATTGRFWWPPLPPTEEIAR
ncbi:acyltransferase domain-containing protein [Actinomadura barringtoniae]|uniref:Acyltransferase domain-containing protein n=1 Tax=Actinomadura barringtoniae TaxID=1427535 RepID=A0A939PEU0_9ACTN|nr:type I polyketide synthase [Actinomadura barringtoniae]MBO2447211.1 acyltransferase domain-containing protein [Actinomadura barringtoniae]